MGRGTGAVDPTTADRKPLPTCERVAYGERNASERPINRLKRFCPVATRHEKQAVPSRAMLTTAAVLA